MVDKVPITLKWYVKLVFIGFSLLVTIGIVEVAGRAVNALPPKGDAEYRMVSREVGRLSPPYDSFTNHAEYEGQTEFSVDISLDKLGFRADDPSPKAAASSLRIILLGDSYTAGWQLPESDTWSSWLASDLRARGTPAPDVINLGYPGWGTAQEYLLYSAYAHKLNPDLVVLTIYAENDISDNGIGLWERYGDLRANRTYFTLDDAGQLVVHPWPYNDVTRPYLNQDFPSNVIGWLNKNSVTYRVLRDGVRGIRTRLSGDSTGAAPTMGTASEPAQIVDDERVWLMNVMDSQPDATWEQAWTITGDLLAKLRDAVEANGAQLVTAIVPPHMIVQQDSWTMQSAFDASSRPLDLWYPHERMLALLAGLNIPTLDPTALFLDFRAQTGRDLYFLGDPHFNATGTCVFGTALANWLTAEGYVDGDTTPHNPVTVCAGE